MPRHQHESHADVEHEGVEAPGSNGLSRGAFLKSGVGVAAMAAVGGAVPGVAAGARMPVGNGLVRSRRRPISGDAPVPPLIRSRRELESRGIRHEAMISSSPLPITQGGTTYAFAQETVWLDTNSFAVGRWDGTMSIFDFETGPFQGPLIQKAVNDPAQQGVQMITHLSGNSIVTSNDFSSIVLWTSASGNWTDLTALQTYTYPSNLGWAVNGAWFQSGSPNTLVVGHSEGYISIWKWNPTTHVLTFQQSVNLRNPNPTNPFNSHYMYGVTVLRDNPAYVLTGSDDGYISIVQIPSGNIMSQTVYSPIAQRGINSVSVLNGNKLLVANCSVGPSDFNLWYYSINTTNWSVTNIDKTNLIVDTSRPQVFNFDSIWGAYSGGTCWFASTEEGTLWMGTADTALHTIGYEILTVNVGSALAYQAGHLVMVESDLMQFVTGA
jgi:WD40 repeat protein